MARRKGGRVAEAVDAVIFARGRESFQAVFMLRMTVLPLGMQHATGRTSIPLRRHM